jgi:hypothetical protein
LGEEAVKPMLAEIEVFSRAPVDETLLTNYLGPYCLTELLLPTIKSEKIKKIELNVPKKN